MFYILKNKLYLSFIVSLLAIIFTLSFGNYPSVFIVGSDISKSKIERVLDAPVHLSDDVMITLRAGYKIKDVGFPAFNDTDTAQASTSYIAPYIFAGLEYIIKDNFAVIIYAILGIISVFFTFFIIMLYSKSITNAVLMVSILTFSSTNLIYTLNGWDHLFQALFLALSLVIVLNNEYSKKTMPLLAIFLAFGTLFRPDGILIALSIIIFAILQKKDSKEIINKILLLAIPYMIFVTSFIYLNYLYFGYITPTTARLKIGASPDILYSIKYILNNGIFNISAITICILLFFIFIIFFKNYKTDKKIYIIFITVIVTCFVSFINSDVFEGGRLYWSSAIILSILFVMKSPSLFLFNIVSFKNIISFNSLFFQNINNRNLFSFLIIFILIFSTFGNLMNNIKNNIKNNVVTVNNFYSSPTAQQYIITKWINSNLNPKDGAIGFYYLGVSFHLPKFEISDFLGKADESIAQIPVKWGPPGHNKWNEDISVQKWHPQVIVPPGRTDKSIEGRFQSSIKAFNDKVDYGFAPSLMISDIINQNYTYCYIDNQITGYEDKWGFYIRNDILFKHRNNLKCIKMN